MQRWAFKPRGRVRAWGRACVVGTEEGWGQTLRRVSNDRMSGGCWEGMVWEPEGSEVTQAKAEAKFKKGGQVTRVKGCTTGQQLESSTVQIGSSKEGSDSCLWKVLRIKPMVYKWKPNGSRDRGHQPLIKTVIDLTKSYRENHIPICVSLILPTNGIAGIWQKAMSPPCDYVRVTETRQSRSPPSVMNPYLVVASLWRVPTENLESLRKIIHHYWASRTVTEEGHLETGLEVSILK